ncbi:aldehyde dehydrogenase family protein [Nonomuraea sp. NPDC050691]|uniref:aldehyde dehydrogenase family protein n=1 Tax=Nonomuraea sp. NPDC050691 TaxID=3155661 RepID=UPI0034099B75
MELLNLVNGRWIEGSGAEFADTNPAAPGEIVARGRAASPDEVELAVGAARDAAPAWRATPHHERAAVLARAAVLIDAAAEEWGRELSREEGKTLPEAVAEVRGSARILRYYAAEADRESGEIYASPRPGENLLVMRRPVGVAGLITPSNFPIAIPAWKIGPALTYGNTVVWKPTGSTEVGRAVIARCGELAKPVQTEMGGKNAAVVLADADLDHAAVQVCLGAFRSTGQKCTATSRLVVEEAVAADLLRKVAAKAEELVVGDPVEDGVETGPLVSAAARERVAAGVLRAVKDGAEPLAGGRPYSQGRLAEGWFTPPTVLALPGTHLDVWSTELFGPVVGAVRASGPEEALRLANHSEHGLSAAIFTRDLGAAPRAVDDLDVGVLHVNSESAGTFPWVPFGGSKLSGFGPREQGRAAREFFTQTVTVYLGAPA